MATSARHRRQWLPYTAAVTAGLVVIAGAFVFVRQREAGNEGAGTDCAITLHVNSSTE